MPSRLPSIAPSSSVEACFSKTRMGTHLAMLCRVSSSINRRYHTTSYYSYRSHKRGNRAHGLASRDGLSRIAFVIEYSVLEARSRTLLCSGYYRSSHSDAEMSVLIPNAIRSYSDAKSDTLFDRRYRTSTYSVVEL
jgi:hypothetical protein